MNTTTIGGVVVVLGTYLCGVRWWAQIFKNTVPLYDPVCYIGTAEDGPLHYFRSHRNGAIIIKTDCGIISPWFRPFLIDIQRVENLLDV